MEIISDEIFRAIGYLIIAAFVFYAWKLGYDNAEGGKYKDVLWKGFLWCCAIAFFASISLGSATCEQVSDPVYGGCDVYADDAFEPTTEQRTAQFAYYLTLLYVPVVVGAIMRKNQG
jgi:hypothetical protein